MTQKLSCHHGHRFEAAQHADALLVCPLCGAVTRFRGKVETKGRGSLDRTINLPTSGRAETPQGETLDKTRDITSPTSPAHALLRTASLDERANGDAPSSDTDGETSGARTRAFDKTLNLDGPIPKSDHTDESANVAQTVVLGKTLSLDDPPHHIDSTDESSVVSATTDVKSASTACGETISPAPLQTLDEKSPPVVEDGAAAKPASPTSARASEVKPPDLPGYKVLYELGRGGMGVVYRAKQEKRNREVALKTLLHISPVELQRFKQEFRSLADIAHPNLAGLYDLLSDGETWCFSMEILEAVDFIEYVWSGFEALQRKKGKKLVGGSREGEPRLSAEIKERLYEGLKQLALGLNALHQAGMLHRDIKPSNVLVTTEGRVVLVDFGLASQFEEGSEERPTGIQGTPEYMAPEQAACNPLSPASDWYAVGVMLYEVLTGYWPIQGEPMRIIFKKQTETPKAPREMEPTVPDALNGLCVALLDRDQGKRPTAADILRCIGAEELIETLQTTARVGSGQTLELVGREPHLQGLHSSFRQVVGGMTKTIFVHGKSGMGKSVLIQKFLGDLREEDQAVVLSGRCYEQESVPFKALDNLIDSLADHLTGLPEAEVRAATPDDVLPLIRLFPVLGQIPGAADPGRPSIENVDQQELRQRAMNALRELLKRLGERKPLVLYIDDLQWGDEDSADLLADLVRPPEAPRVLVLGSYRTENRDASFCLKALDKAYATGQHRPHREEIAVESLQEEDAKRLALMLLGRDDEKSHELAGKIARESRGWPFFVWELAQHVQDTPEIADQSLELDEVIWTRVHRLPEETRRLLELVAVTGRPIPALEAYQAIGALDKGQSFLAQLRTRNFVRTTESEDEDTLVETYHDRIRESVVDHLDTPTVQRHSLNLARTIERVSGINVADLRAHIDKTPEFEEPDQPYALEKREWQRVFDLAYFFDAAGESERAFPFALVAAEQARSQNALEVAEQQFRIALNGADKLPAAIRFRVIEGLGSVLLLRGRYEEASVQLRAARSLADGNLPLARIEGKLGGLAFKQGDMSPAGDHLKTALTALNERPPSNFPTLLLCIMKESAIQLLHTFFPSRFVGRRDANTENGRMDLFRARLLDEFTYVCWFSLGMELTLWSHLRQLNLAERYPPTAELAKAYSFHSIVMTALPHPKRGIDYAKRSHDIWKDRGDLWGQGQSLSFRTFSYFVLGQPEKAIEASSRAVDLLEQAGDVWECNMARMMNTWTLYQLGDLKNAFRQVQRVVATGREVGDYAAMAIGLWLWMQIDAKSAPQGAMQAEVDRLRDDPLSSALATQGRGLELLWREDNPLEAAKVIQASLDLAKSKSIRNVCVFAGATWKVTALRVAAEREPEGPARLRMVKQGKKAARTALGITNQYRTCRAHLLRECGLLEVLAGREQQARQYFDGSIALAEEQGARRERATSQLARGQAGANFGWPNAEADVAEAQPLVEESENLAGE